MHHSADANLDDLAWTRRHWSGAPAYAEEQAARRAAGLRCGTALADVLANALEPGWVPTRMGGAGAPDDMDQAHRTQAWLAVSDDPSAKTTGEYLHHLRRRAPNPQAREADLQGRLLAACERYSSVRWPSGRHKEAEPE